jgi:hypothetical protein
VLVNTTALSVAHVSRAWIVVVAVRGNTANADSFRTCFAQGAGVLIVTKPVVVSRFKRALAGDWVTGGGKTLGSQAFRSGAFDYRIRGYRALLWKLLGIAKEGSIADILVFKCGAIHVLLAVAGNREAAAGAVKARVVDHTRVTIVATCMVECIDATTHRVATVIRAEVVVVTVNE